MRTSLCSPQITDLSTIWRDSHLLQNTEQPCTGWPVVCRLTYSSTIQIQVKAMVFLFCRQVRVKSSPPFAFFAPLLTRIKDFCVRFPWLSCRCRILNKLCQHSVQTGIRGERSRLIILSDSSQTAPQHSDCHNL